MKSSSMELGWLKRGTGGSISRTIEVWTFAIRFLFKYLKVEKLKKGEKEIYSKAKKEIAIILRDKLLELGPTFIKLGQLLSTRIDILPREYIDALELLQDKVPGFSGELAVSIIEEEFGKPISQIYDSFNTTPLAAASLGQVHLATLNGKTLAIKIQRQGLKNLFDMDLKNIKVLAVILDKLDPKTDGASRDWVSIYEESAKLLYKEIDYKLEALNSIRFKENFANNPWVKVPDVYLNLTSPRVVTMEYVPGIKINDIAKIEAAGIDRKLLAKRSAESYLTQLCRHGFFHCDPHPGNIACDNVEGGRLIYYDFGMMDELKLNVREGLVNLIFSVYENEPREACNALEQIDVLKKGVDRVSIEKVARVFLNEFNQGVESGKWTNQLTPEEQKEIRRKRRVQLGADLFSVGNDVPFKFPPTFTFVFRAFTSLDGIGKGLDSKYDLPRLAQPFLKELIDLRDGSAFLSLLKSYGKKLGWRPIDINNAITSPRQIANVNSVITKMEQGDLKLRVRVIESERAFQRMEIVQNNMALAIAASGFINMGLILSTIGSPQGQMSLAAKALFGLGGLFGIQLPIGFIKLKSLDKKLASIKEST
uniref:ABC1 atypical kinase-like domain-containing protein n=1 Tax=Chromulina nebulosa TaxID=96789 RepID=A0A7S0XEN1_9STRA